MSFPDNTIPISQRDEDMTKLNVRDTAWIKTLILNGIELKGIYLGTPVNDVAAVQATKETIIGGSTFNTTSIEFGPSGNSRLVNFVDPGVANAEFSLTPNGNELDVNLATDAGDAASVTIPTSGDSMIVESPYDNGDLIQFQIATLSDLPLGPRVVPSADLTAEVIDTGVLTYLVNCGTAAGVTTAVLTVTESVGASGGQFKIDQKAAYIGSWANTKVRCQIVLPGTVGSALSAIAEYDDEGTPTMLSITVSLATDSEGLPDAAANTDTLVVAAVNAALAAKTFDTSDWSDVLLCTKLSSSKIFSSPNAWVSMADGVDALIDNAKNTVALLKIALEAQNLTVTTEGTGYVTGDTADVNFAGKGDNYLSTTTVADVILAVNEATDLEVEMELTDGDGADLVTLSEIPIELEGGVDAVTATPGLLAIDDTSLYVRLLVDDVPTTWTALAVAT